MFQEPFVAGISLVCTAALRANIVPVRVADMNEAALHEQTYREDRGETLCMPSKLGFSRPSKDQKLFEDEGILRFHDRAEALPSLYSASRTKS